MDETTYTKLLHKAKLPIPMKGIEVSIILAVSSVLIIGILCSIVTKDWNWLSRCGSIIVIIGIYLAWKDLVSVIGDVRKYYSEAIQSYLKVLDSLPTFDSSMPGGIISQTVDKGIERREKEDHLKRELDLLNILKRRVRTAEAIVISLGTLINAFGSLVPTIF